jgi:hypothetical protein
MDNISQSSEWAIRKEKELDRYQYLVKSVFNSAEGRELMQVWSDANELISVAQPGMDLLEIGLAQGERDFTRKLKLILKIKEE